MIKLKLLWISSLLVLSSACSLGGPSKPSQFYVLSMEPGTVPAGIDTTTALSVGVGPVFLPDILNRPQIVTRAGPHRIDLAEFDRWGGDLNQDLLRVMSQNLMQRLNTDNVITFPWQRRDNPALHVSVRFFRFDGALGQEATLSGIWQVLDGKEGCLLGIHRFDLTEKTNDGSYAGLVDALSRGVASLTQEIAQDIARLAPGCSMNE